MEIRFVTAGGGDVVAVMAAEGGELFDAGKALDEKSGGRIAKAMKAARFTGAAPRISQSSATTPAWTRSA